MPRLFFALQPQPEQQAAIAAAMLPVVQEMGARPVAAADLHLTLVFLGEVTAEVIPEVRRVAAGVAPCVFKLVLTHLDWWKGAGVLCLLPDEEAATQLVPQFAQALRSTACAAGIAADAKPFRVHVTVARKASPALSRSRHWPQPLPAPLRFTADGFVLMESTAATAGSRYRAIGCWPAAATDM